MMDKKELENKLEIILNNDVRERISGESSRCYCQLEGRSMYKEPLLVDNPNNYKLEYENLDLLVKLFGNIKSNKELKKLFIDYLSRMIYLKSHLQEAKALAFETLIKIGCFETAIDVFINEMRTIVNNTTHDVFIRGRNIANNTTHKSDIPREDMTVIQTLDSIIKYEYNIFNENELKKIKNSFEQLEEFYKIFSPGFWDQCYNLYKENNKIIDRVNRVLYNRLKYELESGTNIEINADKERVITVVPNENHNIN